MLPNRVGSRTVCSRARISAGIPERELEKPELGEPSWLMRAGQVNGRCGLPD